MPIPAQPVPPLREHFEDQDAEKQATGDRWQDWDLMWCGPDGRPIDPHDDWDEWKALLAEAASPRTPGSTMPGTPLARCWVSSTSTCM